MSFVVFCSLWASDVERKRADSPLGRPSTGGKKHVFFFEQLVPSRRENVLSVSLQGLRDLGNWATRLTLRSTSYSALLSGEGGPGRAGGGVIRAEGVGSTSLVFPASPAFIHRLPGSVGGGSLATQLRILVPSYHSSRPSLKMFEMRRDPLSLLRPSWLLSLYHPFCFCQHQRPGPWTAMTLGRGVGRSQLREGLSRGSAASPRTGRSDLIQYFSGCYRVTQQC